MHQHFIGVAAEPFPVIDLVHDFEVARIAERLGIGTVPDGAQPHLRRQHHFGEFLGRLAHLAIVHHRMRQFVAGAPQRTPLLQQPRLAALECLDLIEIVLEVHRDRRIGFQDRAVGAQQSENVGAESAIFLRHELTGLADEEWRARGDLRLRVAREELVELDEAIDEIERHLRSEDRAFGTANARGGFENRQSRLLDAEVDGLADFEMVVVRMLGERGQAAQADVMQAGKHSSARSRAAPNSERADAHRNAAAGIGSAGR